METDQSVETSAEPEPAEKLIGTRRRATLLNAGAQVSRNISSILDLEELLARVWCREDGMYRAISSRFLGGVPAGPFNYKGKRRDDPAATQEGDST